MTLCENARMTGWNRMETDKRLVLRTHRETIVRDLEANDVLDELYSEKVLSLEDTEKIKSQKERSYRVRCLLDILDKRGDAQSYERLVEALRHDYQWLALKLEQGDEQDADMRDAGRVVGAVECEREYEEQLTLGCVPRLPAYYVPRASELERVREALRDLRRGGCVALCGMPGCGKSVLAAAAVREPQLVAGQLGGRVWWLACGEAKTAEDAAGLLHRLGRMLEPGFIRESPDLMRLELVRSLATHHHQDSLLVLDDVGSTSVFAAFDTLGCKLLLTTQNATLVRALPDPCHITVASGFAPCETLELWARCAGLPACGLPPEALRVHELCRGAPLIVTLLASVMEPHKSEAADPQRWRTYLHMIKDKKDGWLANIFRRRNKERSKSSGAYLGNTIRHCLEQLSEEAQEHYRCWALFPEDVNITCKTLEVALGKSQYEVEDTVAELCGKSLLGCAFNRELQCYVYGIHTLLQDYVRASLSENELRDMHRDLVWRYLEAAAGQFGRLPHDNYIHTYIGHHLDKGKMREEMEHAYSDVLFLGAKVRVAGVADLLHDLRRYRQDVTGGEREEALHRVEAVERWVAGEGGRLLCERPHLCATQLALCSREVEVRRLGETQAARAPHRLYVRCARSGGDGGGVAETAGGGEGGPPLDLGGDARAACFAHRADLVLVGGTDGRVRMRNLRARSQGAPLELEYHGHRDAAVLRLEVAPDQTRFLSLAADGRLKVWPLDGDGSGSGGDQTVADGLSPSFRQRWWLDVWGGSGWGRPDGRPPRPPDTGRTFDVGDSSSAQDRVVAAGWSHYSDDLLVAGTHLGRTLVWNVSDGRQLFDERSVGGEVSACALAGDDRLVVFVVDRLVYVHSLESGEYLGHLVDEPETRQLLVAGPEDGLGGADERLVVRSRCVINVWRWKWRDGGGGPLRLETAEQRELARLPAGGGEGPEDEYSCAAVTWDGRYVVGGTARGALLMWSLATDGGGGQRVLCEAGPDAACGALCLDTFLDERNNASVVYVLLSGGGDGRVRHWLVPADGAKEEEGNGDGGGPQLTGLFSARWLEGSGAGGAPLVAAVASDGRVRVHSGRSFMTEAPLPPSDVTMLCALPDGRHVAFGTQAGLVLAFDYRSKQQRPLMHLDGSVTYLDWVAADVLLAATDGGCVMAYVMGSRRCMRLQRNGGTGGLVVGGWVRGRLVTASRDGCVKSWDTQRGELHAVLVAGDGRLTAAAIVPNGTIASTMICVATCGPRVRVYRLGSDEEVDRAELRADKRLGVGGAAEVTQCAWSRDARRLACGVSDGAVHVLHVAQDGENVNCVARLELGAALRWLDWGPPPGAGTPHVLATACEGEIAWWEPERLRDRSPSASRTGPRRRSAARRSRPDPLDLKTFALDVALPPCHVDEAWCGKRGPEERPELLGSVPLTGDVTSVVATPDFTRFVTVDSAGIIHLLNVLRSGPITPSPT